jgi:DNA-binding NarL/FixJ family response regulator
MKRTPHHKKPPFPKIILGLDPDDTFQLTPRQTQILLLILEGKSNTEIATTLDISINTVKAHVSRILPKLKVKSRAKAVALFTKVI